MRCVPWCAWCLFRSQSLILAPVLSPFRLSDRFWRRSTVSGTTWRNPIAARGDASLCHSTGIRCSPPQRTAIHAQSHSAPIPGSHQTGLSVWCPLLGANYSKQVDKFPSFLMKDCGTCGHRPPSGWQVLNCKLYGEKGVAEPFPHLPRCATAHPSYILPEVSCGCSGLESGRP